MSRKTYKQLEREVKELKAQMPSSYVLANQIIEKAGDKYFTASGVLLELTAIGGRQLIEPVMIRDGLSKETIEAIKNDLKRCYDLSTILKLQQPKELKQ